MKIQLITDFGQIPFTLSDIKIPHDDLKNTGVSAKVDANKDNITPFELSTTLQATPYNWAELLDTNGFEPFSFYDENSPTKTVLQPVTNYKLY
tara:strand:- start:165 stop:443 length:279 start_codon:yes stop_codon:yes gene_type:complete